MIDHIETILRRGPKQWTVIAEDQILQDFFSPEGDYMKLVRRPSLLVTTSGGNSVSWKVEGDTVVLSHQYIDDLAPCRVKIDVLKRAAELLATGD